MELTDRELDLILDVFEAHSAIVFIKAATGNYDPERAKYIRAKMLDLSKKIYAEVLRREEKRNNDN